jgi:hypothetical protein
MPLFYLAYTFDGVSFIGGAIIDAIDEPQARRAAMLAGIDYPGALAVATRVNRRVPPDLIGRKLSQDEIRRMASEEKPPASSVRRRGRKRRVAALD